MNFVYNTPILNKINIPNIQFRAAENYAGTLAPKKDSFSTNPLYDNFVDRNTLTQIAKSNPRIMELLKSNQVRLDVNIRELEKLKHGHLMDTRVTAAKIYSALPQNLKSEVNLIPDKILNKNGKLTDKEKEIMKLHSELGYELLKEQGVNENVLNLVKYHHQTPDGNGYPEITNDFKPDISSQILAAADKYSALREKRSYKDAMTRDEALAVIQEDVTNGLIAPEVYSALARI